MRAPRVLIIGKRGLIGQWLRDVRAAFEHNGCEARAFWWNEHTLGSRLEKMLTGRKGLASRFTCRRLARSIADFKPDLVLTENAAGLSAATWEPLADVLDRNCRIVGWLCDCPGSPASPLARLLDRVYYFDSYCLQRLQPIYESNEHLRYLPLAVNERLYRPGDDVEAGSVDRLLFAGMCTPSRRAFIDEVQALSVEVDVYGPGRSPNGAIRRREPLGHEALSRLYHTYAATLNINQPPNTIHGLNLRTFEVTASGGLLLSPNVFDLPRCFEPGREVLAYGSAEEAAEQFARAQRDRAWARSIADAGRRRTLANHTHAHRARFILNDLDLH